MKSGEYSVTPRTIKITEVLFSIIIAVFLVLGIIYIVEFWNECHDEAETSAMTLARSAAAFIPADSIKRLNASESDLENPVYVQIKDSLIKYKDQNREIHFAYIYTQKDGRIILMADSELPGSDEYSPPGQHYTEAPPIIKQALADGKSVFTEPITDRWGVWVSVLVPIIDPQTVKPVAVFGIDYPAEYWYQKNQAHVILCVILVACLWLLIFGLSVIIIKNKKLREIGAKLNSSELLFRNVFKPAPVGIAIGRDYMLVSNINPVFERILGRTEDELTSTSWTEFTHPDDLQESLDNFHKFKQGETDGYSMKKRYIKPDGSCVWVRTTVAPFKMSDNPEHSENYICLIEDITKRMEAEEALRESERSKAVLLSHLPGMAYRCSNAPGLMMQYVSDGCFRLTGYQPESLINSKELSYTELIVPEHREILWREWVRVSALRIPFRCEYEIITAGGERKWVLELGQGIYDEAGCVEALEGIVIDITEQKLRETQILYMRDHDFLTGVHNRRFYEEEMKKMDKEDCLPLSVFHVDINGVRFINDAFGYDEGDRIIIETAKILKECCREQDVLARLGGGEFGLLLPNTENKTAHEMAKKIINASIAHNRNKRTKLYDINLSIGFATREKMQDGIEETAKHADEVLRQSKLLNEHSSHNIILSSVMATMYERSQETKEHAERIASLAKQIGKRINLPQESLDGLELLSLLHDIGKVGIDNRILTKPDKLNKDEWAVMKKHAEIGYRIATASPELAPIADYILSHHERWDGNGYPKGLKEEEIPLLSRILALADAYDAMTEDRAYRKAMTREAAIEEISRNAGTQFDPHLAQIFIESIQNGVQLREIR